MINKLLTGVAFAALSTGAFAADLPSRTKAPATPLPAFTWTGMYVGGSIGAITLGTTTTNLDGYDSNVIIGEKFKQTGLGVLAGVTVGFNQQLSDNLVVGVEADYSFANASNSVTNDLSQTNSSKINSFGTVRGRLGYAVGQSLFFVTGGLAVAGVESKSHLYYDVAGCRSGFNKMLTGWTAGLGVERAITNSLTVKLDGLYYDLGNKKANLNDCGCRMGFKNSGFVARAGVNFKF